MGEHRAGERLDVVRERVVAALERGVRLRGAEQHQPGAGARAELEAVVRACRLAQRDHVAAQRLRPVDRRGRLLGCEHRPDLGDRLEVEHAVVLGMLREHVGLLVRGRVAEREPDHEAVELRLGERIGALVLDRVLGGDDEERPRELVRLALHRHPALLHALEQPRLGLRRRAVDLVNQHDVGEHRAGVELEPRLAAVEHVRSDHVGGEQVGRALHARVLGVERARERPRQRRLADPRIVLDQDVAIGEQRDEQIADDVVTNLERPPDVVPQSPAYLRHSRRVELWQGGHSLMVRTGASERD